MIRISREDHIFLLTTYFFCYLQSIVLRITVQRGVDFLTFTPEAAIYNFICALLAYYILRKVISTDEVFSNEKRQQSFIEILFSLCIYLLVLNGLSILISLAFGNFERNVTYRSLLVTNSGNVLYFLIYALFYFSYTFFKRYKVRQQLLFNAEKALNESKIQNLKTQLTPHFLFNNLNTLDELIHYDQNKASSFLTKFADIYRYALETSDKKLVSLKEEIEFSRNYFTMVDEKYPGEYDLTINIKDLDNYVVPPFSIQTLIENVIKHNIKGSSGIIITIDDDEQFIVIKNSRGKKPLRIAESGRGLNNLKDQFSILSNRNIEVLNEDDLFQVKLPKIYKSEK
ncbi:sensor histidine kinase [Marinigracilibium pacificum]|uniref:Histidine kinase n=1 Tax=Marinigracilibium pacificum TaxID=2729599 RepID=A0A848J5H4_9BACT|nr:histidine kinase [Marinigracilibium pacificum]NMM49770.1 histidine kinase [Marinigracilibium pacificum]